MTWDNRTISSTTAVSPFLVERIRHFADHRPERRVYTFLGDREGEADHLTFGEIDLRARAIAVRLRRDLSPGDRALLVYPPGLDYILGFLGCLYAGVVAVPAYPPNPLRLARTLPRLQAIVSGSGARLALTTSAVAAMAHAMSALAPELSALEWVATDSLDQSTAVLWQAPPMDERAVAFLQYTSGSTGDPRGVMVTHGNLAANAELIARRFALTEESRGCSWLPPYHDMGLIGTLLQPLYTGFFCVLMSPLTFLKHPIRWLRAISEYRVDVSGGPNFAYDLCVRKVAPEQCANLDLRCWRIAFNGSEPVRLQTIEQFARTFAVCGFRREAFFPCYGLAEATLLVSGGPYGVPLLTGSFDAAALEQHRVVAVDHDGVTLVGCGAVAETGDVRIVDPETCLTLPPDRVGEVWVAGPGVAAGYWGLPGATRRTFDAWTADDQQGPFLRTGDYGFFHEGQLFITGRLKDLIIIDGRNIYPQDIEATVEQCHTAVKPGGCAAFAVDTGDGEQVIVAVEINELMSGAHGSERESLVTAIRREVAEQHELRIHDVVLLKSGSLPKTSSGKLQRSECRALYLRGELKTVAV
jgi:acyl-CoA synthetase (AMP-forming)/AMP-acid ligase II